MHRSSAADEHSIEEHSIDEHSIVARVRSGDVHAFDDLYRQWFERLWRFAYRYLRSRDQASDLVQDVFADVWMRRAAWQPHTSIPAYLFRAVRNRIISSDRHVAAFDSAVARHGEEHPAIGTRADPPDLTTEQADTDERLRHAIDRLTERQRAAVLLRWDEGLNAVETAAALGVSEAAVRKLLAHARDRLAPFLQ